MKRIILKSLFAVTILCFATSCQKVLDDIQPSGSSLSLEQLQEGAAVSEDRAGAGLPGMYAQLNEYNSVYAMQGDFGYPSFTARLEHAGDNVVSTTHGYNWFNSELRMSNFQTKTSTVSVWSWIATYKNIKLANDIIAPLASAESDPVIAPVIGEAKAMRAWDYFLLAQLFGKTYKGNESSLCVPLITHETPPDQLSDNPRLTVQEIYDFILSDLDDATRLLKGHNPSQKSAISEAVVYGIRSRVHLVMNNWSAAEADARKAIELFSGSPFTIDDVSIPNFDDVQTGKNSMWGIIIGTEDDVTKTGIANWTSMMTSLCFGAGGYTTMVGTYKMINTRLWKQIPETDVRRGWWAYEQVEVGKDKQGNTVYGFSSPLLTNAYSPEYVNYVANELLPFSVVKFAPNEKSLTSEVNAVDFQLMRIEEMYYNLAEAQAMGGNVAAGVATLVDFVKKYRDPAYAFTASSPQEVQDEIYLQKRVEFWGEGISWFDMLRMKKGINRVDLTTKETGGYPALCRFNIPAGDPTFTFQIPLNEEQNNKAIEGNNNPAYTPPTDMI